MPVGDAPTVLVFDRRAGLVLVVTVRGNSISVIDVSTRTVLRTVPVGALPDHLALNQRTGRSYVADWASDTVSILEPGGVTAAEAFGRRRAARTTDGRGEPRDRQGLCRERAREQRVRGAGNW